jgi:FkbM family methyltransferase
MQNKLGSFSFDPAVYPPGYVFPEAVEDVSADLKRVIFPGGFSCYAPAEAEEAALIYNEIIVKQEYFQYGLSVAGAHCVLDVGANIGIFTLGAKLKAPDATVYAFEPIQDIFQILERNVLSHGWSDVYVYNVAIGSQDHTEKAFTFYPHMPGNTTATPALKVAQKAVMDQLFGKEASDFLLEPESRRAQVRTLSSIIQEQRITAIDYLKVDVEGDELAVLEGIAEMDWPIIRQLVVETHNEQLREEVYENLVQRNFEVYTDRGLSSIAGVSNVYARRS